LALAFALLVGAGVALVAPALGVGSGPLGAPLFLWLLVRR